jgi:hypothetical protein
MPSGQLAKPRPKAYIRGMPSYVNTYVAEDRLSIYEGADFDEVLLADRSGELGAVVWCWTRRDSDLGKASWLRLIVAVDEKDSLATVERVREALKPQPVPDPTWPAYSSYRH